MRRNKLLQKAIKYSKKSQDLIEQYKDNKKYLVLVAYDCLWPHINADSYDFIVVLKHTYATAKSEFSFGPKSFNDIVHEYSHHINTGYENCTGWLTKEDINRIVNAFKRSSYNTNHPNILTLEQFKRDFHCYD